MKITIQAVFSGGEEARLAASSLAAAQGGGLELSISTHSPGEGISYHTPFSALMGRYPGGRWSPSAAVRSRRPL